jgi:hypothetical protein
VPGVGPAVVNRFGAEWSATYRSLRVVVESYDSVEAAEAGRRRSGDTRPVMPSRREDVAGRTLTWWGDGSLLGRAGRFVVNLSASRPDDVALVRKVFDYLAPVLETIRQPRPEDDAFVVMTGDGYLGAVVPASSPWHSMFKPGLIVLGGAPGGGDEFTAWTPAASDIEALERELKAFVAIAARDPSRVADLVPEPARRSTVSQLPWLHAQLGTLKRQYFGVRAGGARRVFVHGFVVPDGSTRWRSEPIIIMDGGCGNVWFDVQIDERRVARFVCGALAAPAPASAE